MVWSKEKQALEKRIERLLQQCHDPPTPCSHPPDLLFLRLESKVAEQAATISALREEISTLQSISPFLTSFSANKRTLFKRKDFEELKDENSALKLHISELKSEITALKDAKTDAIRRITTSNLTERAIFAEIFALKEENDNLKRITEEANSLPSSAATSTYEDPIPFFEKIWEKHSENSKENHETREDDYIKRLESDQRSVLYREKRAVVVNLCSKLHQMDCEREMMKELVENGKRKEGEWKNRVEVNG